MAAYILRRILLTIPTLALVAVIVFALIRFIPGDPAQVMLGPDTDPATVAALRHQMGLDQPLVVQFFKWLDAVLHGDFGVSVASGEPVAALILDRFRLTASIVVVAVALAKAAWARSPSPIISSDACLDE